MTTLTGLTAIEVQTRVAQGATNQVDLATSRTYSEIFKDNAFSLINIILYVLGAALILLGRYSDAFITVIIILFNVVVAVVQEIKAKRQLDKIALLTRPKAKVIRGGSVLEIDPNGVVLDDILEVESGDQIVVDGIIVDGFAEVNESLLTGESENIYKKPGDHILSGSYPVSGKIYFRATEIGEKSFANKLTKEARKFRKTQTPMQKEIVLVIKILLLFVVTFCSLLCIKFILQRASLPEVVSKLTVIAGLVPNALFVMITLAYALGAVRILKKGALIQQLNAIESLSNVDVLCVDKTGTLTQNKIVLDDVEIFEGTEETFKQSLGFFANSLRAKNETIKAIVESSQEGIELKVEQEIPFSSKLKYSALVFKDPIFQGTFVLGAAEILEKDIKLTSAQKDLIDKYSEEGNRVLLLASSSETSKIPEKEGVFSLPKNLKAQGLAIFTDKIRADTAEIIEKFKTLGVKIKVISGDNPKTVLALAKEAGISSASKIISGNDLKELSQSEFENAIEETDIFGRITPEQKERIIQTLRDNGNYVAMIGDGVNDVLSLKKANLGIAMEGGSQAARSIADMILLKNSFASLPAGVEEGQRIRNGLHNNLKLFLSRVVYVFFIILAVEVSGLDFPLNIKQSSIIALLTVGIPALALTFWASPKKLKKSASIPQMLNFVIPAVITISFFAFTIYVSFFVANLNGVSFYIEEFFRGNLKDATLIAQTAMTIFLVIAGLLLVIFNQPPVQDLAYGSEKVRDWKPTILVIFLFYIFIFILTQENLRVFWQLQELNQVGYISISIFVVLWVLTIQSMWKYKIYEKFLGIETREKMASKS